MRGTNIAEDITYSGTCAAAMEATLFGRAGDRAEPGIQGPRHDPVGLCGSLAADAIRRIAAAAKPWPKDTFFNVNFPAASPASVRGLAITHQGKRVLGDNLTEGVDPRGRPYYWIGPAKHEGGATPDSDLRALEENRVSITPVHLDLTNVAVAARLRQEFE